MIVLTAKSATFSLTHWLAVVFDGIISNANMPLLRFKGDEWNSEIIKREVARALKESTLEKL